MKKICPVCLSGRLVEGICTKCDSNVDMGRMSDITQSYDCAGVARLEQKIADAKKEKKRFIPEGGGMTMDFAEVLLRHLKRIHGQGTIV